MPFGSVDDIKMEDVKQLQLEICKSNLPIYNFFTHLFFI